MATITQPRLSVSTSTSTRTSLDTTASASAVSTSPLPSRSPSRTPNVNSPSTTSLPSAGLTHTNLPSGGLQPPTNPVTSRRNRAALRDYYGLKKAPSETGTQGHSDSEADTQVPVPQSELDNPGFLAESYVSDLLATEGLESLLRAESGLVNEVKFLTSERAALVYDNYSKLIAATDTIKRMRSNMALTPATSTLAPAVSHIADTAGQLALKAQAGPSKSVILPKEKEEDKERLKDVDTVRWVLDTPQRIRDLGPEGAGWERVNVLLDLWDGVGGVEKLRGECERALEQRKAE